MLQYEQVELHNISRQKHRQKKTEDLSKTRASVLFSLSYILYENNDD